MRTTSTRWNSGPKVTAIQGESHFVLPALQAQSYSKNDLPILSWAGKVSTVKKCDRCGRLFEDWTCKHGRIITRYCKKCTLVSPSGSCLRLLSDPSKVVSLHK